MAADDVSGIDGLVTLTTLDSSSTNADSTTGHIRFVQSSVWPALAVESRHGITIHARADITTYAGPLSLDGSALPVASDAVVAASEAAASNIYLTLDTNVTLTTRGPTPNSRSNRADVVACTPIPMPSGKQTGMCAFTHRCGSRLDTRGM